MPEDYGMPWVQEFLEDQTAQRIEDIRHPEGHLLGEVVITGSNRPEDRMRANLQVSIERRQLKDAKDNYTLLRNMNQALTNFAQKVGLPLMFMPAAPLATLGWSFGSPAFHGAALAIDKKVGGHTADNIVSGAELGLMGLGVGAGAYTGGRALLNNTNLGRAWLLSRAIGRGKVRETPNFGSNISYYTPSSSSPQKYVYHWQQPSRSTLTEAERLGIPKGERNISRHATPQAPYYDYSLINKHYEPWTVNEKGLFVFESPEKARKLGTLHFTFNEPVMSHIMGSWDDAPTITLLPYRNVRSLAAPVDVAIMDTFFPNYKGLKISSRGAKTLTGDKKTFDYYKSKGLDVEFSPEIETKLLELKVLNDRYEVLKTNPDFDYFSKETQELLDLILAIKESIDGLGREWAKTKIKPIPSYEKVNTLGTVEGLDIEKYPYSLASPKYDAYGIPLEASDTELNYTWQSDPSNHFMIGEHPEVILESALRGDYGRVRPEFIKYLEWASKHKADYRKLGGKMNIIEKFKEGRKIRKMQTAAGGPLINVNESTRVLKPFIPLGKKINKISLSDNIEEISDNGNEINVYPNLKNDKYLLEFFEYDYAPRFKRENEFASQEYVNAAKNIYKNTPVNIFYENSGRAGFKTGGYKSIYNSIATKIVNGGDSYVSPHIYLNSKYKISRPVIAHELTHAFRLGYLGLTGDLKFSSEKTPIYSPSSIKIGQNYLGSGYSKREKDILNETYNMKGYRINYDPLLEKGTTNTEVRFRLWKQLYDKLGRRPSLEETDKYIKTYDGEKLLEIIRDANSYGETMYNNGMLINLIKNALINVAQNNSNNAYLLNDQTYYAKQGGMLEFLKNGSGIHIKKANRGKFTEYCGGKVTSECIARGKNSSDPAVRKRATFAANARKWKHKKGGKAFVEGVSALDSNPKAYKRVRKMYKMRGYAGGGNFDLGSAILGGVQLIGTSIGTGLLAKREKEWNESIEAQQKAMKANALRSISEEEIGSYAKDLSDRLTLLIGERVNVSPIDIKQILLKKRSDILSDVENYSQQWAAQKKLLLGLNNPSSRWTDLLSSVGDIATGLISQSTNKNNAPSTTLTNSFLIQAPRLYNINKNYMNSDEFKSHFDIV